MPQTNADTLKALKRVSQNVVSAQGRDISICSYCESRSDDNTWSDGEANYYTTGLTAVQLSCETYQRMLDLGWRRSGMYCSKPDLKRSCCPSYSISLDALEFKPSRSQRKVLNRWNRFVVIGDCKNPKSPGPETKRMATNTDTSSLSLSSSLHTAEFDPNGSPKHHKFEVILEAPSYTAEKYTLFEKYQAEVHHDNHNRPYLFYRFFVETPLISAPIPYPKAPPSHLPSRYGSYHQAYRLDGHLIALSVFDVLPQGISSVYFMYDVRWAKYSLGKLSAMREAGLVRDIHNAGIPRMQFLYLGFYIHNNSKMRYKAEFSPSYLADPEEYTWHPIKACLPLLDQYKYACFAHPEHSLTSAPDDPDEEPVPVIPDVDLDDIRAAKMNDGQVEVIPIKMSDHWLDTQFMQPAIAATIHGLGVEIAKEIVFH